VAGPTIATGDDIEKAIAAGVARVANGKQDAYDCTEAGPDSYVDLSLKFGTREIAVALGDISDGNVLVLQLTAKLVGGVWRHAVTGEDVVVILAKR